jgi:isoquinoline 1-oxidoreductase beta subunit
MSAPSRISAKDTSMKSNSTQTTRRDFLKTGAAAGASLIIGFHLPASLHTKVFAENADGDFAPNAFIEIRSNGDIFLTVARTEMGQGVRTSMAMILAEELDADWSRVKVKQADFDVKYGDMTTGGQARATCCCLPRRKP